MKTVRSHWIAEVPSGWRIDTPRFAFSVRGDRAKPGMEQMTASQQYGVIPQSEYIKKTGSHVVVVEKDFSILKAVYPGDFVIHMRSFQGGLELSEVKGCTSSAYVMLIPGQQIHSARYYRWVFKCDGYINELQSTSNLVRDGQAMRWANFIQVPIPFPPPEVQDSIAQYLDRETERIEKLRGSIRAQIDALEAYRSSLISQAVYRGINNSVDLTDSGIEWVGKVPSHWQILPIRTLFTEVKQKNVSLETSTALQFKMGRIVRKANFDPSVDSEVERMMRGYTLVSEGDIIINGLNLNYDFVTQRVAKVVDSGAITSAYLAIRPKGLLIDSTFATYCFKAWDAAKAFHNIGEGVRKILNYNLLKRLPIAFPEIDEQLRICSFLDSRLAEIDDVVLKKERQLAVLDSFKSSLIYEMVTGKREVPVR